ncbi:PKD domain-containing protein [Desulfatitalea alkaliphila]|uniref:PKD domain-containing protein n=1 Tax=Desulfatitalea alkaliphila TaxID=2929485 RepID=A0AA41UK58_9BACT|nr:PKD domain-containing protein [Desulfatitalea alkaliphila]MCJ8500056.1 PKD domain-containing protein [Desulfatitalea alkaliphila]
MFARRSLSIKRLGLPSWALVLFLCFCLPLASHAVQVTLAWDANDAAPDGYRLFQRTEGGTYNYNAPVWNGAGTSATVDNLAENTTYHFVVRAFMGTNESGDSNEVEYRYEPPTPVTYTISASAGANGAISPSGSTSVAHGGSQSYTITPATGYRIAYVVVNGSSVGAVSTYTFGNVTADQSISAYFTRLNYTISASAGANGAISPSGSTSVAHGGSQSYTITPATGYRIADVQVNGTSVGALSSYTFSNVTADQSISASFTLLSYTISASAGANGALSPSGSTSVAHGGSQSYTITPATGYRIADVQVNGTSVGALSSYTFSNVTADQSINASFALNSYTISAVAGENGTVSPSGSTSVLHGSGQTYTISADEGYRIDDVRVNGSSVGAVFSYTFSNVTAHQTLEAWFSSNNLPPVADAGPDQTVDEAEWVTLSGLNSHDPDDGIADFRWRQIQGPTVALSDPNDAEPHFQSPDVSVNGASLVFELTVTDHSGAKAMDTCIVNVIWVNVPPTAQAGADQTVYTGDRVVLDGTNSVDPDDGIAGYFWTQTGGPTVALSDPQAAQPYFDAPDAGMNGTSLRFELTVVDHGGLQASDDCVVTVAWVNQRPTADAGPDQQVPEGAEVILDGSNSIDPDDGIATYRWRQVGGSPVTLTNAGGARAAFVAPFVAPEGATLVFQLTVTDHEGLQHDDQCMVNVLWENRPPVASAGGDQTVDEGSWVQLDGSGSSDPDDGIAAYQWSQASGPKVALSDARDARPSFKAPDVGPEGASLGFTLTVTDYSGLKNSDTCVVNVSWLNQPPLADAGGDHLALVGDTVTLDGSASRDNDDGIATYRWGQVSGPPVALSAGNQAVATFTVPETAADSVLVFELTVTDHGGLQGTDRSTVDVPYAAGAPADTTPPEVAITSPSSSFIFVSRSTVSLQGIASDDTQVQRVEWHNDRGGSGAAKGTDQWRIDNIRLARWFNTITVTAYDAAGNQSSTHLVIFASYWW